MSLCDDLRNSVRQKHFEGQCELDQNLVEALAVIDWMERNIINVEPLPKFNLPSVVAGEE